MRHYIFPIDSINRQTSQTTELNHTKTHTMNFASVKKALPFKATEGPPTENAVTSFALTVANNLDRRNEDHNGRRNGNQVAKLLRVIDQCNSGKHSAGVSLRDDHRGGGLFDGLRDDHRGAGLFDGLRDDHRGASEERLRLERLRLERLRRERDASEERLRLERLRLERERLRREESRRRDASEESREIARLRAELAREHELREAHERRERERRDLLDLRNDLAFYAGAFGSPGVPVYGLPGGHTVEFGGPGVPVYGLSGGHTVEFGGPGVPLYGLPGGAMNDL